MAFVNQSTSSSSYENFNEKYSQTKQNVTRRVQILLAQLKSNSTHTSLQMSSAGFTYTGDGDTIRCNTCKLEVSEWSSDMTPLDVHIQRSPDCSFIQNLMLKSFIKSDNRENCTKRQKLDSNCERYEQIRRFFEINKLKEIRHRTYSHWSYEMKPFVDRLITAGFFATTVKDRVICLYCGLICQEWQTETDDPSEVHRTRSLTCPYVLSKLTQRNPSSTVILNENSTINQTLDTSSTVQHPVEQIVSTAPIHPNYSEITQRQQSFTIWSHESAPPVDELVRAGFFYTGIDNNLTCFYCGGSLKNWNINDNPIIEHVRCFPHCQYAKQLCGDDLHRKSQDTKKVLQDCDKVNHQFNEGGRSDNVSLSNQCQLHVNDPNMLSRFVAARLDLSSSQNLLNQKFKLSVIKRCWEDQLQLKIDDFASDSDLLASCIILQKQIDCIKGEKENIVIPSREMQPISNTQQSASSSMPITSKDDSMKSLPKQSDYTAHTIDMTTVKINSNNSKTSEINPTKVSSIVNLCVICNQEEKRLACIPCGHLVTCALCSKTLRTCPTCRKQIEAFVRIFI
ncbi:unnamed protein product [Rotaria socialis]|uniref:RING-type domain-containing protein n=3 Tax=Rotaria socialis TaxID=392032 RepID=A0A821KGW6_9BILA|nr:unnamed protein product [Rotaria socialis]CAF4735534.1 unnamed protein product [Rotaria socialis]